MYKGHIFKKLLLTAMALLMLGTAACKKDDPSVDGKTCSQITAPADLLATWSSAGGDGYQFSETTYAWGFGNLTDQVGPISFFCQVAGETNQGYIVYKLTSGASWAAGNIGKYTVTKWKNLSGTSVQLANAYKENATWYSTANEAVQAIISNAANEAEYFGIFGNYTK